MDDLKDKYDIFNKHKGLVYYYTNKFIKKWGFLDKKELEQTLLIILWKCILFYDKDICEVFNRYLAVSLIKGVKHFAQRYGEGYALNLGVDLDNFEIEYKDSHKDYTDEIYTRLDKCLSKLTPCMLISLCYTMKYGYGSCQYLSKQINKTRQCSSEHTRRGLRAMKRLYFLKEI